MVVSSSNSANNVFAGNNGVSQISSSGNGSAVYNVQIGGIAGQGGTGGTVVTGGLGGSVGSGGLCSALPSSVSSYCAEATNSCKILLLLLVLQVLQEPQHRALVQILMCQLHQQLMSQAPPLYRVRITIRIDQLPRILLLALFHQ